jgi:hypothetical protein
MRLMKAASDRGRRVRPTPGLIHVATLVVGLVVLVVLGWDQWFFNDDWTLLTLPDPMRSHVGHWNSAATLIFNALFAVFGLTSYLPYLIPAILAHLAVVHLTWRLLLRVGVSPWLATLSATTILLFGAAAENMLWAFQVGFMGAMALALGALLLVDRARLTLPTAIGAGVLAIGSLPFASTGLPILAAVGIVAIIRHGWWRAVAILAPAGVVYLVWFLTVRVASPDILAPHGVQYVTAVPLFIVVVITAAYGQWVGPIALGPFIALGTLVWIFRHRGEWFGRRALAYALLVGVVIFALLTSLTRGGMAVQAAAAERYVYIVVVMSLPLLMLIVDVLWRLAGPARLAAALLMGSITITNAHLLYVRSVSQSAAEARVQADLSAAAGIVADDPTLPDGAIPVLEGAPDVTVAVLRDWIDDEVVPEVPYGPENIDRVRFFLQITAPAD